MGPSFIDHIHFISHNHTAIILRFLIRQWSIYLELCPPSLERLQRVQVIDVEHQYGSIRPAKKGTGET
jgi:hypothetical protein